MATQTSNIKDTLSTICGVLAAIGTSIIGLKLAGMALPEWLTITAGVISAVGTAIIGFLTGKTPSAAKKTQDQVVNQNEPNP